MKHHTQKRLALFWASVPIAALAVVTISWTRQASSAIASVQTEQETTHPAPVLSLPREVPSDSPTTPKASTKAVAYSSIQVSGRQSITSLKAKLGQAGMEVVLKLNRLDSKHLRKGATLVLPDETADLMALSPFPREIASARSLPKLILVSREAQAFGAYESGKLVHWGPTSTGKKSTQTPAGLFHTNWRKKETRSSVNPAWILPWAFNLDNFDGIAFHQYDLPGFPASHGCVRLLNADAQWIYGWADTWILSKSQSIAAYGTPVIIFGDYAYGKEAPWKRLPSDPEAATVTTAKAEAALNKYLTVIEARAQARESLLLLASSK